MKIEVCKDGNLQVYLSSGDVEFLTASSVTRVLSDAGIPVISIVPETESFNDLDQTDIEDVTDLSDGTMVSESSLDDANLNNAVVEGSASEDSDTTESYLSRLTDSELEDCVREIMVRLLDK